MIQFSPCKNCEGFLVFRQFAEVCFDCNEKLNHLTRNHAEENGSLEEDNVIIHATNLGATLRLNKSI